MTEAEKILKIIAYARNLEADATECLKDSEDLDQQDYWSGRHKVCKMIADYAQRLQDGLPTASTLSEAVKIARGGEPPIQLTTV